MLAAHQSNAAPRRSPIVIFIHLSQACLLYIATDVPLPNEEVVHAVPKHKEEVIDAAPQHKEEVDAIEDGISPEICLSHLPATEEVGGQQTPSRVLAAKSLADEAPAPISYKYSDAVQVQFKQCGPMIDPN